MMQACRLAGRTAKKHGRELTRCGLIYLGMVTAWGALGTVLRGLPGMVCALGMGYLYAVISLSMSAWLLCAVSRPEQGIRLSGRAWGLLLALPLAYLPPLWGACALLERVNVGWQDWAAKLLGGGVQAWLTVGACVCAGIWVFSLIGAFTRLTFLRALRGEAPRTMGDWAGLARRAVRHSLAPAGLWLRYLPVFLLAGALWLALEAGAGLLAGTFAWQADMGTTALVFLAHLLTPHPWTACAAFLLGPMWMLGAGVYLWPRVQLARVCYFYRAGK